MNPEAQAVAVALARGIASKYRDVLSRTVSKYLIPSDCSMGPTMSICCCIPSNAVIIKVMVNPIYVVITKYHLTLTIMLH